MGVEPVTLEFYVRPVNFAMFYFYDIFQIYQGGLPLYSARTVDILETLLEAGCPIDSRDQQVGHF